MDLNFKHPRAAARKAHMVARLWNNRMSAAQIARHQHKSTTWVYRYLAHARHLGLIKPRKGLKRVRTIQITVYC